MNMSTQSYEQLVAGANLIRTNELPESNTHTLVGEQLLQMVNKQQEADDSSRSEIYNVSRYHVNTDGTSIFTLAQAIAMVPARLRVGGTMIKFQSSTGELIAYFNGSAISSWSNVAEWRVFISDKDFKLAEKSDNKNQPNGYPGLDAGGKLLASQLPDSYQPTSEKGRANGYPALDNSGTIPDAQIPNSVERTSKKNQANGYPGLNSTGKLLASQLPDTYQSSSEKGRANGYPALDNSGTIPDAQIPNTVERVENKNKANGYAGLDADGLLDNRMVRKAFGYSFANNVSYAYITNNNLLNPNSDDFTIETILYPREYPSGGNTKYIITKYVVGVGGYVLYLNATNIRFTVVVGSTSYFVEAPKECVLLAKYNHIIATVKNRILYLYCNGELIAVGSDIINGLVSNEDVFRIGASAGNGFNGTVTLLRFYRHGFNVDEVAYYYNAGRYLARLNYFDKVNKLSSGCVLELLPENVTSTKWLDTQNGLDFVISGNPSINYGSITPEPYVYPEKKVITLSRIGTGAGGTVILARCAISGYATIYGGKFYKEQALLNEVGDKVYINKNIDTYLYFKVIDSIASIEFYNINVFSINHISDNSNSAAVFMKCSDIFGYKRFQATHSTVNSFLGRVLDLGKNNDSIFLQSSLNGGEYISGNYTDLPRDLSRSLYLNSLNVIGNIKYIPKNLYELVLYATKQEVFGNISDLPYFEWFEFTGSGNLDGDLSELKKPVETLSITSANARITLNGYLKLKPIVNRIIINPAQNVFTSAMVDKVLNDAAAQITAAVGSRQITLTGNCGVPTTASAGARNKLSGLGITVLTN